MLHRMLHGVIEGVYTGVKTGVYAVSALYHKPANEKPHKENQPFSMITILKPPFFFIVF